MKETVFGVDADAAWSTAFGNRPAVSITLVVVIVALAVLARTVWVRLPERDWSIRFDVDKPTAADGDSGEPVEVDPDAGPELRWPVVEKIVLISLVGLVFSQMLGVNLSNWQVLPATAVAVLINASISHLFVRNGSEWGNLVRSFVTLAALNTVILTVYAWWAGGGRVNRAQALFFGVLLTLMTVMYDRFRGIRLRNVELSEKLA